MEISRDTATVCGIEKFAPSHAFIHNDMHAKSD